jgi:hypothetical protein
VHKA